MTKDCGAPSCDWQLDDVQRQYGLLCVCTSTEAQQARRHWTSLVQSEAGGAFTAAQAGQYILKVCQPDVVEHVAQLIDAAQTSEETPDFTTAFTNFASVLVRLGPRQPPLASVHNAKTRRKRKRANSMHKHWTD